MHDALVALVFIGMLILPVVIASASAGAATAEDEA